MTEALNPLHTEVKKKNDRISTLEREMRALIGVVDNLKRVVDASYNSSNVTAW